MGAAGPACCEAGCGAGAADCLLPPARRAGAADGARPPARAQASHANRALALGPRDGKLELYVSVPAPFNVDTCTDPYCSIYRLNTDGSGVEKFAGGERLRGRAGRLWAGCGAGELTSHVPGGGLSACRRPNRTHLHCPLLSLTQHTQASAMWLDLSSTPRQATCCLLAWSRIAWATTG